MDLQPELTVGIDEHTLRVLDVFLLWAMTSDSPPDSPQEIRDLVENQRLVAARGREPGLKLRRHGERVQLAEEIELHRERALPLEAQAGGHHVAIGVDVDVRRRGRRGSWLIEVSQPPIDAERPAASPQLDGDTRRAILLLATAACAFAFAFILKRLVLRGARQPLLMELPQYRLPKPANVALGLWERSKAFLKRAGSTIFLIMVAIWFLAYFPQPPAGATEPAIHYSFAGMIGEALQPLLAPIGFTWEISISLIPGMAAREVIVGTLGTVLALGDSGDALSQSLSAALAQRWTLPTALSLLAWYVFAPQCASTLALVRRETSSTLWPTVMFIYMLVLAYAAAFATYHAALALT